MKTIEKLENVLHQRRGHVTLLLLMLLMCAYAFGRNNQNIAAYSADEMYLNASEVSYDQVVVARYVPVWAPVGVNPHVRYYYLPAAEVYYDAFTGQYIYYDGWGWVYGAYLPPVYSSIDLYTTPIIFLSIGVSRPWNRHAYYVEHYHYYMPSGWGFYGHGHPWRAFDENRGKPYPKYAHRPSTPIRGIGNAPIGPGPKGGTIGQPGNPRNAGNPGNSGWKGAPSSKPNKMEGGRVGTPAQNGKGMTPSKGGGGWNNGSGQEGKRMAPGQSKPPQNPNLKGGQQNAPGKLKLSQGAPSNKGGQGPGIYNRPPQQGAPSMKGPGPSKSMNPGPSRSPQQGAPSMKGPGPSKSMNPGPSRSPQQGNPGVKGGQGGGKHR
jgi:hypothetical protein